MRLKFVRGTGRLVSRDDLCVLPGQRACFSLIALRVLQTNVPIVLSGAKNGGCFRRFLDRRLVNVSFFSVGSVSSLVIGIRGIVGRGSIRPTGCVRGGITGEGLFVGGFAVSGFIRQCVGLVGDLWRVYACSSQRVVLVFRA